MRTATPGGEIQIDADEDKERREGCQLRPTAAAETAGGGRNRRRRWRQQEDREGSGSSQRRERGVAGPVEPVGSTQPGHKPGPPARGVKSSFDLKL